MLHLLKQKSVKKAGKVRQICVLNTNLPLFHTPEIQNCPRFWQWHRAVHTFHTDREAFRNKADFTKEIVGIPECSMSWVGSWGADEFY